MAILLFVTEDFCALLSIQTIEMDANGAACFSKIFSDGHTLSPFSLRRFCWWQLSARTLITLCTMKYYNESFEITDFHTLRVSLHCDCNCAASCRWSSSESPDLAWNRCFLPTQYAYIHSIVQTLQIVYHEHHASWCLKHRDPNAIFHVNVITVLQSLG